MPIKAHYFILLLIALCAAYLGFEFFFNSYALITVDEFWFAHRTYQYKSGLPYLDFAPYKTVIGYYILLVPMLFSHGIITTLIAMKDYIAILNTVALFGGAFWLSRFFVKPAILLSLAVLLTSQLMLFDSTNIRVDLLGYWFGFFSLLSLMEVVARITQRRLALPYSMLAGLLMGLAFCTTQKTIWYLAASDIALASLWLFSLRSMKTLTSLVIFNITTGLVITIYLALWSHLTSWNTVYSSVFLEASAMYHLDWYASFRKEFWGFLLFYNPLIFFLWPLSLFTLLITPFDDKAFHPRAFIVIYAAVILGCLIPYKQIFPYYLQVSLPILFVLFTSLFSWLLALLNSPNYVQAKNKYGRLWVCCFFYIAMVAFIIQHFKLSEANLLICVLPILFCITAGNKLTRPDKQIVLKICLCSIFFVGVIYPFKDLELLLRQYNGKYQQANIQVMNTLLKQPGHYIAGIELLYNTSQTIPGLRHLMIPAVAYLYNPTQALRAVMLPSLYEDPNATPNSIINALNQSDVKFYVNNYRIAALPPILHQYLQNHFEHYWGSIYLYAPLIPQGAQRFDLKFSGNYLIESQQATQQIAISKTLNGTQTLIRIQPGATVYLEQGTYVSDAKQPYRLKMIPASIQLNPAFAEDKPEKFLF